MKRAVIFLHGDLSDPERIIPHITKKTLILCADGGAEHALRLHLVPHAILGDFDSISPALKKKLSNYSGKWIPHSAKKDQYETDAQLAVDYALQNGVSEIIISGFWGRRIDHVIANLMFFATLPKETRIRIIEGNQIMYIVHDRLHLHGEKGQLISLIPLIKNVCGATITGVKYPLNNADLPIGSTLGVSNVMTGNQSEVKIKEGTLLVVHTFNKIRSTK